MERISSYTCVYNGCKNCRGISSAISFHNFPVKDVERCKVWIINSGNEKLIKHIDNLDLFQPLKVCEKHFTDSSFNDVSAARKTLIRNAIPINYMEEENRIKVKQEEQNVYSLSNSSKRTKSDGESSDNTEEEFDNPKKGKINETEELHDEKKLKRMRKKELNNLYCSRHRERRKNFISQEQFDKIKELSRLEIRRKRNRERRIEKGIENFHPRRLGGKMSTLNNSVVSICQNGDAEGNRRCSPVGLHSIQISNENKSEQDMDRIEDDTRQHTLNRKIQNLEDASIKSIDITLQDVLKFVDDNYSEEAAALIKTLLISKQNVRGISLQGKNAYRKKYQRQYWKQRQEEINRKRRENRLQQRELAPSERPIEQLDTNDVPQESHITIGERTSLSRREYKRQYWEQHKEEINRRRRESRKLAADIHIIEPLPNTDGFIEQRKVAKIKPQDVSMSSGENQSVPFESVDPTSSNVNVASNFDMRSIKGESGELIDDIKFEKDEPDYVYVKEDYLNSENLSDDLELEDIKDEIKIEFEYNLI